MADAPALGAGTRKSVEVQVLSWAPFDSQALAGHLLAHGKPRELFLKSRMTVSDKPQRGIELPLPSISLTSPSPLSLPIPVLC